MYCTYTSILPGGGDNSLVESDIKGENFAPFSEGEFNLNPEGTVFYYNQDRETERVYTCHETNERSLMKHVCRLIEQCLTRASNLLLSLFLS